MLRNASARRSGSLARGANTSAAADEASHAAIAAQEAQDVVPYSQNPMFNEDADGEHNVGGTQGGKEAALAVHWLHHHLPL